MTTEQRMLASSRRPAPRCDWVLLALALSAALTVGGCFQPRLQSPAVQTLLAPYDTRDGELLWAVAPLRNESGTSAVDELAVSDTLAAQLSHVRGLRTVPVNRSLAAMRAAGISSVQSPAEARRLAEALGVDGVVVGSITAWDPYKPPEIGLSLALYGRSKALQAEPGPSDRVDPRAIQAAGSDFTLPESPARRMGQPLSTASEHVDGANHRVQAAVRLYAQGRHDFDAPMGWRRYLASMSLFTEFACRRLVDQLLDAERRRLARAGDEETASR